MGRPRTPCTWLESFRLGLTFPPSQYWSVAGAALVHQLWRNRPGRPAFPLSWYWLRLQHCLISRCVSTFALDGVATTFGVVGVCGIHPVSPSAVLHHVHWRVQREEHRQASLKSVAADRPAIPSLSLHTVNWVVPARSAC